MPDYEALKTVAGAVVAANNLSLTLSVQVSVTDGVATVSKVFAVQVNNVDEIATGGVQFGSIAEIANGNVTMTATNNIVDPDLAGAPAVVTYAWQSSGNGTTWIAASTGASLTVPNNLGAPTYYRINATYTDLFGSHTLTSAQTALVGTVGNNLLDATTANLGYVLGKAGVDTIQGFNGTVFVDGGAGNDTIVLTAASANVSPTSDAQIRNVEAVSASGLSTAATINLGNLSEAAGFTITGGGGNDLITGSQGADTIATGAGNDTIFGAVGADTIDGGTGTDTLAITAAAAAQTLLVKYTNATTVSYDGVIAINVENVTANLGAGNDTLSYAGTVAAVNVSDNLTTGTASGFSSIANIENLTGGDGNDTLIGNNAANTLTGGNGNDTLDGGTNTAGGDTLVGGNGDDTYVIRNNADTVNEATNAGTDRVLAYINTYTLAGGVENLTFLGTGNFTGNGNALDNVITGGAGTDTLSGGGGNDTLIGGAGSDTLTGGNGSDLFSLVKGDAGGDLITDFVHKGTELDVIQFSGYAPGATLVKTVIGTGTTPTSYGVQVGGTIIETFKLTGNLTLTAGTDYKFI